MDNRTLLLLGGAHVHLNDHLAHASAQGWHISHVHDRNAARRERLCKALNARPIETLGQLGNLRCAGALVCSETIYHREDISSALEAGLPVFAEKPLAASADAARACSDLAKRTGLLLHTGYFFRTNAALQRLKDHLSQNALGDVIEARFRFSHDGGYADWLDLDCWMTDPALACYDGFVDEAVHMIDLVQWLIGPVAGGYAITDNALGWPVDDHGAALLDLESGALATVEAGWTDTEMRLEIDIVGTRGNARLRDGILRIGVRGAGSMVDIATLSPLDAGAGLEPFLAALNGEQAEGLVPPDDAVAVNRLIDAMGLRLG